MGVNVAAPVLPEIVQQIIARLHVPADTLPTVGELSAELGADPELIQAVCADEAIWQATHEAAKRWARAHLPTILEASLAHAEKQHSAWRDREYLLWLAGAPLPERDKAGGAVNVQIVVER